MRIKMINGMPETYSNFHILQSQKTSTLKVFQPTSCGWMKEVKSQVQKHRRRKKKVKLKSSTFYCIIFACPLHKPRATGFVVSNSIFPEIERNMWIAQKIKTFLARNKFKKENFAESLNCKAERKWRFGTNEINSTFIFLLCSSVCCCFSAVFFLQLTCMKNLFVFIWLCL